MQSNVDLCSRWSHSNSYHPTPPRPSPPRLPIPRAALYFTRAHQPGKYYVFPLYEQSSRSDYYAGYFRRAIAKFRAARLRVGSRPFSDRNRLTDDVFFIPGQSRRNVWKFPWNPIGNYGQLVSRNVHISDIRCVENRILQLVNYLRF